MHRVVRKALTLTVTLDAYEAVDVVGGLLTWAVTGPGLSGLLRSVLITDDAAQSEQFTLYLFDSLPSTIADAAAFAPTIADLNKVACTIGIATADWTEIGEGDYALIANYEDTQMQMPIRSDNGSIYGYLVAVDTPDYVAADDLVITLTVEVF